MSVLKSNPFSKAPPIWTVAIFLEDAPPANTLATLQGQKDEEVRLGKREIYVAYGAGMARSKLKIPAAATGTARKYQYDRKSCRACGSDVRLYGDHLFAP